MDPPVRFPSWPESGSVTNVHVDLHKDLVGGYEKWHQEAEAEHPCSSHVALKMEWI